MTHVAAFLLGVLATTPEASVSSNETWFEHQAVRAALHMAAGRCRDGLFEHCYDSYHSPPIEFFTWWPTPEAPDADAR